MDLGIAPSDVACERYTHTYAVRLSSLLAALDVSAVGAVAAVIRQAWAAGRTIYLLGNGGSAATATHIAQDLRFQTTEAGGRGIRAVALVDNVPSITALGNDRSYADIFVGQLEEMVVPGDVLIAISASGNSENVLRAVRYMNDAGGRTIGFVGFDGGLLKPLCQLAVHVRSERGEYAPVEDLHLILGHILCTYLRGGYIQPPR